MQGSMARVGVEPATCGAVARADPRTSSGGGTPRGVESRGAARSGQGGSSPCTAIDAALGSGVSVNRSAMDRAQIVRLTSGFGTRFEALRTAYESQTFARHTHDTYTLGLVLGGAGTFWCHGGERFARQGDLVVIPPGEVHTGSVATGADSLSYLAVYLPVALATLHAHAAGLRGGRPPEFGSFVLRDPAVRRAYLALDRAIGSAAVFPHGHAPCHADVTPVLDDAAAGCLQPRECGVFLRHAFLVIQPIVERLARALPQEREPAGAVSSASRSQRSMPRRSRPTT